MGATKITKQSQFSITQFNTVTCTAAARSEGDRGHDKVNVMDERAGYVLVGGKSSRLGTDKALLDFEGKPLVTRVANVVRAAAGRVTIVGPLERYRHLGLRVIPDPVENFGPLAGLLAALEDSESAWNLVTACDMPYLDARFLSFLFEEAQAAVADILLPVDSEGNPEPLCAVYSLEARSTIRRRVEQGVHKITRAFEGLRVDELAPDRYARFDPEGRIFTNLNTLEDVRGTGLGLSSARGS
jgi:molybdopterin-guanine dinucleotide biosynthesis protein A